MEAKVFDAFLDGVAIIRTNRQIAYVNPMFAEICGVSIRSCLGKDIDRILKFDPASGDTPWKNLALVTAPTLYVLGTIAADSQETKDVQVALQPIPSRNETKYYLLYVRDMTLETRLRRKYRTEVQKYESLASKMNSRIIEAVLYANISEADASRFPSKEVLNRILANAVNVFGLNALAVLDVGSNSDIPDITAFAGKADFSRETFRSQIKEFWDEHKVGISKSLNSSQVYESVHDAGLRITCWPIEKEHGLSSVMIVFRDQGGRRKFENDDALLGRIATHIQRHIELKGVEENSVIDTPTQLQNKRYLLSRLGVELEIARKSGSPISLIQFDIDNLREVNANFGGDAGDLLVNAIAQTAKSACRESDILTRYGGGQFTAILLETVPGGAAVIAERIRSRVQEQVIDPARPELRATVSLGIAAFPTQAKDRDALLAKASLALAKAKSLGRNNIQFYSLEDEDTHAEIEKTMVLPKNKAS